MGSPLAIVITDSNGKSLTVAGATSGSQFAAPTPCVLTDVNGNALVLSGSGGGGVTSVATSGLAIGGPITSTGTVSVAGSGNATTAATALSSVTGAPAGDVITTDGSGNVQDSGTLLSSIAPLSSPTFTGTVTSPAGTPGTTGAWGLGFGTSIGIGSASSVVDLITNSTSTFPSIRFYAGSTLTADLSTSTSSGIVGSGIDSLSSPGFAYLAGLSKSSVFPAVLIGGNGGNNGSFTATSGTQLGVSIGNQNAAAGTCQLTFAPTSGTANFVACVVTPTINQTGTASGNYTALAIQAKETALLGSGNLLISASAGSAGTTSKFTVDNSGNVVAQGTYTSGSSAGVSAGPFSAITSIQTVGGIVTTLADVSDERLKDSSPYEGGLRNIAKIKPIRFSYNDHGANVTGFAKDKQFVGFSAQNVRRVLPEAVTQSATHPDYLAFDDRPVIAALVNAVKELNDRIEELEAGPTTIEFHPFKRIGLFFTRIWRKVF